MKFVETKIITSIVLTVLVIITGVVLTKKGSPYPGLLFNVHKLLTLAAITLLVLIVIQLMKGTPVSTIDWVFIILTGLFMIGSLITGGLLNVEGAAYSTMRILHKIVPVVGIILAVLTVLRLDRLG